MTRPTISQILSDPRSADRAALDYCNGEMANCLDQVDALQAENAALWAFVAAEDTFNAMMQSDDWTGDDAAYLAMLAAREALRPYEATS